MGILLNVKIKISVMKPKISWIKLVRVAGIIMKLLKLTSDLKIKRKNMQQLWRKQKQHLNKKRTSSFVDNLSSAKLDRILIDVLLRKKRSLITQGKHIPVPLSQCRHHLKLSLRARQKLETDIDELEITLDHANKANSDLQKHIKKLHSDFTDTQNRVAEQQRIASEYREQYGIAERRANALSGELEESRSLLEQSDRARRQAESDLAEAHASVHDMSTANGLLTVAKRKLEGDLSTLHADLDEMLNEAKHSEEKAKKAMVDAARLADELRAEHDHYSNSQKLYKSLEVTYKELHGRYEESHAKANLSGKQALGKLELRFKELEAALGDEANKYADCMKNFRKSERRIGTYLPG